MRRFPLERVIDGVGVGASFSLTTAESTEASVASASALSLGILEFTFDEVLGERSAGCLLAPPLSGISLWPRAEADVVDTAEVFLVFPVSAQI